MFIPIGARSSFRCSAFGAVAMVVAIVVVAVVVVGRKARQAASRTDRAHADAPALKPTRVGRSSQAGF